MPSSSQQPHDDEEPFGAPPPRAAVVHDLKCWTEYFVRVESGEKPFEVRQGIDRDFRVGDTLLLRDWDPDRQAYTGKSLTRRVTYVLGGALWGLTRGIRVLGLESPAIAERDQLRQDLDDASRAFAADYQRRSSLEQERDDLRAALTLAKSAHTVACAHIALLQGMLPARPTAARCVVPGCTRVASFACPEHVREEPSPTPPASVAEAVRERCAKICDDTAKALAGSRAHEVTAQELAAGIRALDLSDLAPEDASDRDTLGLLAFELGLPEVRDPDKLVAAAVEARAALHEVTSLRAQVARLEEAACSECASVFRNLSAPKPDADPDADMECRTCGGPHFGVCPKKPDVDQTPAEKPATEEPSPFDPPTGGWLRVVTENDRCRKHPGAEECCAYCADDGVTALRAQLAEAKADKDDATDAANLAEERAKGLQADIARVTAELSEQRKINEFAAREISAVSDVIRTLAQERDRLRTALEKTTRELGVATGILAGLAQGDESCERGELAAMREAIATARRVLKKSHRAALAPSPAEAVKAVKAEAKRCPGCMDGLGDHHCICDPANPTCQSCGTSGAPCACEEVAS